jgi:CubicO group peptidase (beta-lactamase class C family)
MKNQKLIFLLAAFLFLAGCGSESAGTLEEQVRRVLESASHSGEFSGNALITRKGQTIFEESFGLADHERKLPNLASTRFPAFSIAKPFTAVLVFQQIEAGKLHLGDSLASFFPNLEGKPAGTLTLHQLLTHTSGINEVISLHRDRRINARDLEAATVEPKAGFKYSNTGYVSLGLVLEAITGLPYEALLRKSILDPADMRDSGLLRTGHDTPGLSRGYRLNAGQPVPVAWDVAIEALDGAGSLYTTARDLWRFDRALASGELLPLEAQALMHSQQVKGKYGYGWFLDEQGGEYFPWHKGDYRGHTAILVRQIHRQEVIVILSNQEEADVLEMRSKILRALKAGALSAPR